MHGNMNVTALCEHFEYFRKLFKTY